MVVQAGALRPYIPGKASVAGPEGIELVQKFNGVLYRRRTGVGAEIF